ncbi:MAG: type I secretion C-terminal target domain-containing protein [Nitrosomonas sp.]|nr:type I secretion C-terminal target domain-containing protein [Nitrosomonas sp.]
MAVINGDNNSNTLNGVFDAGGDVGDTIRGFGGYDTLNAYNPLTINVNWSIIDVLEGGDGNDTLRGKNGGTDKLYGGAGDDYLIPLQRYNEPDGSVLDGTNEMIGGLGNDKYFIYAGGPAYNILTELPNEGADTIYLQREGGYALPANFENLYLQSFNANQDGVGNDLANAIHGNNKFNSISGRGGNDILKGYGEVDFIDGEAGIDQIYGGLGADWSWGRTGADFFFYDSVTESPVGAGRDVIKDFNRLEGDKIDLSVIDANLTLAGNQAFTVGSYVNGILTGDVIGGADLQIELTGAPVLDLNLDIIL